MSATYYDQSYPPSLWQTTAWTIPATTIAGRKVTFGAVAPEIKADSYQVNWGDGTVDYWGPTTGNAEHTYSADGSFTIVMDPYGSTFASQSTDVTVPPPEEPAPEPEPEPEAAPEAPQGPEDDPEAPVAPQAPQKTSK